jgi:hypothetical protein
MVRGQLPKAQWVIVGRMTCGCVMAIANDYTDTGIKDLQRGTLDAIKEFKDEGLTIERVSWTDYTSKIHNEPTFMNCPHCKDGQLTMELKS